VVHPSGLPAGRVEVRICADDECQTASALLDESSMAASFEHKLGDTSRLVVEVKRRGRVIARGAAEVPVRIQRPNGPDCPPECRTAAARFDVAAETLEPS
jgi:hypothetical protein